MGGGFDHLTPVQIFGGFVREVPFHEGLAQSTGISPKWPVLDQTGTRSLQGRYFPRFFTSDSLLRARIQSTPSSTRQTINRVIFIKQFSQSLVATLFSWRCLDRSTSYFLHAAMNLRPPSVTVYTHTTSASNAAVSQSPAMPSTRMWLCTYAIGPLFLISTPFFPHCTLKVSEYDSLWQPPAA